MDENNKETMEIASDNNGVLSDIDSNVGLVTPTATDTVSADAQGIDTDGSATSPNVWTGGADYVNYSVSGGDIVIHSEDYTQAFMEIQETNAQNTTQIIESITACNSLLVLIFAFFLFEWTEKKLKVVVNKFTNKRRH
uniref:hypothetical protein n=1 Tax=Acetatifactor sp. TaxID=1872090 RepID=UPI004055F79A